MATTPSRDIICFGTEQPVPQATEVTAGPVSASFDGGNLRYLKVGGVEILRAVQFIVRDRDWGTYGPALDNLTISDEGNGFRISFDAVCADAEQSLAYSAVIEGTPERIAFRVRATPQSQFVTNRTGFVVLHGVEGVAGAPVRVTHTDGKVEELHFPELIDPMQPFMDIRTLEHEPASGLKVSVTMTGDAYEMEDQRNWSDASYKTYIRPLAEPWPYELSAGAVLEQAVVVEIATPASGKTAAAGSDPVAITIDTENSRQLPRLGLAVTPDIVAGALAQIDLVRAMQPDHFVCHLDLRSAPDSSVLAKYGELCAATDARLVLEAVLPCLDANGEPTADKAVLQADVQRLHGLVDEAGLQPDLLFANPACDMKSTLPGSTFPPCPSHEEILRALRNAFPAVPLGGGMITYFTELNRKRPPTGPIDFITHSTCPIVHAGDDLSVMESLESLPSIMKSTLALADGLPYRIGPTAVGMRTNPYGAKTADNPDSVRVAMARNDPRQRSLMAAAWAIGYYGRALTHGVEAVCLNAPLGPFGAIHSAQPWPQPWFDDPASGARVYPVFHALCGIGAAAGSAMPVTSSAPGKVLGFADIRESGGIDLWLANLTGADQQVSIAGIRGAQTIAAIDETSFVTLCTDPTSFDGLAMALPGDVITLRPYASVRIHIAS